jgi:hypothetical protein
MKPITYDCKQMMGAAAAEHGAKAIRQAIRERGEAYIIIAPVSRGLRCPRSILQTHGDLR